jgi:hypothetical protein
MGNFFSAYWDQNDEEIMNDYTKFDNYSKQNIVDYVTQLKPVALDIGDDFAEKIKDLDLVSLKLLAMNIEFYGKVSKLVPKHKYEKTLKDHIIRQRFVKPKFGEEVAKSDSSRAHIDLSQYDEELNLGNKDTPTVTNNVSNITLNEYIESFRTPTHKKDLFGMSKKMLASMPNFHKQRLISIYNKLFSGQESPREASLGKASFMYKESKKGPTTDLSSFRQIITIPTSLNHFHRILALRMNDFLNKNNYLNTSIQKGSMSGIKYGLLEQIFKVKQIVKDANTEKRECAILFLDISNAFGNLSLKRLLQIMEKYNIDKQFINYVKEFYGGFEYFIQTKNWSTKLRQWEGGLIQGCPLSPTLFVLCMDYILNYLDTKYKEQYGYKDSENNPILLTAYVDDVCIMCKDMKSLDYMFQRIKFLLNSMGLPINKDKCAYMSINPSNPIAMIDNVPHVKVYKYLGEYISHDGMSTESYNKFMAMLSRKLLSLDRKKVDDDLKLKFFSKCMLPWIQGKLMVMYDININEKKKIVTMIKKYLLKWGSEEEIHIFSFIADILTQSTDNYISRVKIDQQFDEDLRNEIELANSSFSGKGIKLTYDNINKEPNVEGVSQSEMANKVETTEEDNEENMGQCMGQSMDQGMGQGMGGNMNMEPVTPLLSPSTPASESLASQSNDVVDIDLQNEEILNNF